MSQTGRDRRKDRLVAWGLTWLAYATYYLGRKGLGVAKKPLEADLGVSRFALAAIDTGHLAAYAVGQLASGLLGDRIGARRLVGYGMLASAALCAWFGSLGTTALLVLAFTLNGFAQSTGWPGTTRAMAEWTDTGNRRRVMAVWCTCYQVGGLAASAITARLLRHGWRAAFFGPAVILLLVGLAVLAFLKPGPESTTPAAGSSPVTATDEERQQAVSAALRSPVLWSFGASYFAIKLVRYSLLFWLPYYLADELRYSPESAGYLSMAFEVGGIVGVVGAGLLTHRFRGVSRTSLASLSLAMLAVALLGYTRLAPLGPVENALGLALVGAVLFAPDSLISGAVAQDVGGPLAAATATGLVNSVGSVGAVFQGFLNVWVSRAFGWHAVFFVFVALSLVASAALLPAARRAESR